MEFTGERYVPELDMPEISYEHWHRYLFASQFVADKVVLDIASGEGFGSNLLADSASKVVGIDKDEVSITHAASRYIRDNLEFVLGTAESVPVLGEHFFDVVTSFETIEHLRVTEQVAFMNEIKRILKPDGLLIMSTPNKLMYSDEIEFKNEFHEHEFYYQEFRYFLNEHFQNTVMFGQRVYPISYIWSVQTTVQPVTEHQISWKNGEFSSVDRDQKQVFYALAVCTDQGQIPEPASSIMLDLTERATQERARLLQLREGEQRLAKEEFQAEKYMMSARLHGARLQLERQVEQRRNVEQRLTRIDSELSRLGRRLEKGDRQRIASTRKKLYTIRRSLARGTALLADAIADEKASFAESSSAKTRDDLYDIVIFPVIPWEYRFQRPQHLATQFARAGHRVFYLESFFHRAGSDARVRHLGPNVYGVQLPGPPGLSIYEGEIDERLLERWIQALHVLRSKEEIEEAVCVVELPFWTPLVLASRELWGCRVIYDCLDDFAGFGNLSEAVLDKESWLIAASDLVLTTSRPLHTKVAPHARHTLLLPNATDFTHFQQVPAKRPLAKLPHPIIGYYGALAHWFDAGMVRRTAKARPEWQFVLIGHVQSEEIARLERLPNVSLLGEHPYSELPTYLYDFDVAIIPFMRTPLTEATNPVKFYEYLSAGKPVVATALPELEPYEALYYPVRAESDFLPQIEAAMAEDDPAFVQARLELARHNTWEARVTVLRDEIARLNTSPIARAPYT